MKFLQPYFSILLTFISLASIAQSRLIEITTKRNNDNTVDFFYEKKVTGSHYVDVSFSQLTNCTFYGYQGTVKGPSGKLFTLKPIRSSEGIGYGFQYRYGRGVYHTKIDPAFVYLLPFKEGKRLEAREMTTLDHEILDKEQPDSWKAYMFSSEAGDTVYSMRKGIVVELINEFEKDVTRNYTFKRNVNYLIIEHKDGTLCKYSGFAKDGFLVSEGDMILPHMPLGTLEQYNKEGEAQLRLVVFYFDDDKYNELSKVQNQNQNYYSYVFPQFHTKSGDLSLIDGKTYEVEVSNEVISSEMTKREKKKYFGDK